MLKEYQISCLSLGFELTRPWIFVERDENENVLAMLDLLYLISFRRTQKKNSFDIFQFFFSTKTTENNFFRSVLPQFEWGRVRASAICEFFAHISIFLLLYKHDKKDQSKCHASFNIFCPSISLIDRVNLNAKKSCHLCE